MKILIATDSFKDALPALEVCRAIERGIKRAQPQVETLCFPLADGGEGTSSILTFHSKGKQVEMEVKGPLFDKTQATYGISGDGQTAFIEMAEASGIQLLSPEQRNPLFTTTLGTGQMILDATNKGVKHIILGLGGSVTNDAGIGMATALGYRFLDKQGDEVDPIGKNLIRIHDIDDKNVSPLLQKIKLTVACDVDDVLYGPQGAAYLYAPQKGADADTVKGLDEGLRHFASVLKKHFGQDFAEVPGAGASGGLGAGAMAFLGAELRSGIDLVIEKTGFEKQLAGSDWIITGEGKIDAQILHGKLISGIIKKAKCFNIPVIGFCGTLEADPDQIRDIGLEAVFSILTKPQSLEQALEKTKEDLEHLAFQVANLIAI